MRKALRIIKNVVVGLIMAVAICMMIFTIVSATTFDRVDRSIFGFRAFIVLSDSMSATDFKAGDLILSKEVDPSTLKEGDIITYQSINPENYGEIVTHKIRRLTEDENGNPGFVTYGTTTNIDDETVVGYNFVLGKYQLCLPGVGSFFQFLKTTPGYIICILIPFLTLILIQGINSIRLFRRYKREQLDEIKDERRQMEEERKAQQLMMQELLKLKEQIAAEKGDKIESDVSIPNENAYSVENSAIETDTSGKNADTSGKARRKKSGKTVEDTM